MPEFSPLRSDAIREGLIQHVGAQGVPRGVAARPAKYAHRPEANTGGSPTPRTQRGRGVQWAAAAVALVLMGGLVGVTVTTALHRDGTVAGTPTPPVTASPLPTPPPTPTPTSTPTPTQVPSSPPPSDIPPSTQDPADPMTWIVSQTGMGPLTIGMPFSAAIAAVPAAEDACGRAYFISPDKLFFARWGAGADDPLDVVVWSRAEGPATAEGIGIGSTAEEVRGAYPDAVEVQRQGAYLQSGAMFFRIETGVVDEIGVTSDEVPWEFCG